MAETTIIDKVTDDLKARSRWEERQPVWYKMRHTGIPRRSKPYPGAPDLHYPFADTVLEKLKPFYFKQLFASEHITELTSEVDQNEEWTEHATRRFDYELKLRTNLQDEMLLVIDAMLAAGLAFCRQSYNPDTGRIEFLSIEPRLIIVPPGTEELNKAFRFTHVEVLSRDQYRERKRYNQDPEFIRRIAGAGIRNPGGAGTTDEERERREGITQASSKDEIVVWNIWERQGSQWTVKTRSPVAKGEEIAPPLRNPYTHGELPYVDFRREIKEKGIYSSRGEVEKVAPFETYLCRLWNKKGEMLDYYALGVFTSDDEAQDGKSVTVQPGTFVPRGLRRVEMGVAPFPIDQEMNSVRMIGEQRVLMPDFGIGEQGGGGKRTATEIEQLANLGGVTTELRAHIFRLALRRSLAQAFQLFAQYKADSLDYIHEKRVAKMPKKAVHPKYLIDVGGTSESWNKRLEAQKVANLFAQLKGDPYTEQLELRKMLVEKTDTRWVRRLVRDPQQQANSEAVDETIKLPAVMDGSQVPVEPQENHAVRAEVLWGKLQQLGAEGRPVDPVAQRGLIERLNARLAMWEQQDKQGARQWLQSKQQPAGPADGQGTGPEPVPFQAPGAGPMEGAA
jgi:hypothetical protein